ncbi:MAG: GNAT family N-acetyltransferase [Janthinobacterium lividum]
MLIRPMTVDDAQEVAALSGQLGYPATESQVLDSFQAISAKPDNAFFVADNGGVVGWLQVLGVHFLASLAPFAEIGGLVVDAAFRRQGVGRALMAQAEEWAKAQGYAEVRLRSGLHRTDAHQFYERIGYTLAKTNHMFCKDVG